jgi:transcription initiation factor TFIID TATA-box-binding protein
MATFIKKNGMKPISNGTISNIENVENFNDKRISLTGKESDILDVHVQSCLDDSDEKPELDIIISNVVCSFSVRCHLNLREIALNGSNVEYRRENGV